MERIFVLLALGCVLAGAGTAAAQAPWLGTDRSPRLAAEAFKPRFDAQDHLRASSSALFLSGRIQAGDAVSVVVEAPVAFGGYKLDNDGSVQVGNPYVGVELGRSRSPVWVELGGRVPLVGRDPNSAVEVGILSDIDRFSAFLPQTAALSGALDFGMKDRSGLGFRARFGPELLVNTASNNEGDDTETFVNYGAQAFWVQGPLDLRLHVGGLYAATAESGDFGERSMHQLGLAGSYLLGGVRPGISLRLPLDHDLTETLDYVLGITLEVPLRN